MPRRIIDRNDFSNLPADDETKEQLKQAMEITDSMKEILSKYPGFRQLTLIVFPNKQFIVGGAQELCWRCGVNAIAGFLDEIGYQHKSEAHDEEEEVPDWVTKH